MTREEATGIVAILNAGFPRESLEQESALLWIDLLQRLDNCEAALSAARAIVFSGTHLPTVAEFRQTYRAEAERIAPPALEQPQQDFRTPEWVRVWLWLRKQDDFRTLPQQQGWDLASNRMSPAEYEQERQRWLTETGGKGPDPAKVIAAL